MSLSSVFGVAASGMGVHSMMMDAVADNVANVNTVKRTSDAAHRPKTVLATEVPNGGVMGKVVDGATTEGQLSFEPDNPLADSSGLVRRPDIDLAQQFSSLMVAKGGFAANVAVMKRAEAMYRDVLDLV